MKAIVRSRPSGRVPYLRSDSIRTLCAGFKPRCRPSVIFAWKNVRKHDGELIGKKQDKAGRWRTGKVPAHSTYAGQAYAIDERMKLGRLERYDKELSKITKAKNLPPEWATPEQRSRAALKALGK